MVKFLFKRVFALSFVLAATAFALDGFRLELAAGIIFGGLFSVYKAWMFKLMPFLMAHRGTRSPFLLAMLSFLFPFMSFALLFFAVKLNVRLFFGVSAGLILMPMFVCVNGLTERIGLTHNHWQG